MPSKSFDNLLKLDAVSVTNNVNTFTTSISAPALSGTHFGDGSRLTGVVASGGTSTDATKLPLAGGTLTGGLVGTTATFSISVSAPALSGAHFGDGSRLTGIVGGSARLALSGGTLVGDLIGTTATFNASVSAPIVRGTFVGDGSGLTGIAGGSARLALSGGTLQGGLIGTTATFNTSVSAPTVRGTFIGDGSQLTGITGADSTKLPLSGGTITGNLILSGTNSGNIRATGSLYAPNVTFTNSVSGLTGNTNWIPKTFTSQVNWQSVAMSSNGNIRAAVVSGGGNVWVSINSGATWLAQPNAGGRDWKGVAMSSDGTIITAVAGTATGSNGYIYVSNDSGATWAARATDSVRDWLKVSMSADGSKQNAVVNNNHIYVSSDSGQSWSVPSGSTISNWADIATSPDGSVQAAVTYTGDIFVSTNSGVTWTNRATYVNGLQRVRISSNKIVATGNGGLYTSNLSGITWTTMYSLGAQTAVELAMSSDGTKIMFGITVQGLYMSTDSGATWTISTQAGNRFWSGFAMSADGTKQVAVVFGSQSIYQYDLNDLISSFSVNTSNGEVYARLATFTTSMSAPALNGAFYGDGSNLTNLDAGYISSGTLSESRLPAAATFTTSISSPAVYGKFYGDASNLTETLVQPSIASTTSLDVSIGTVFKISLTTSITTLNFTNVPVSPKAFSFTLQVVADGTARTIAWPASVKWSANVAPTITSTNGKSDFFSFLTYDGGTTWYGFVGGQNH